MDDTKYCSYCGQPLDEVSTFCVYCQLDSKDFKYDIQEKDYFEVKLRTKITFHARFVAIYSIVFAFLTISGSIGYIAHIGIILTLSLALVTMGVFVFINSKKDSFEEKTFVIATLIINLIFVLISVIFFIITLYLNYFLTYFVLLTVVIVFCIKYLLNVSKYKKIYSKKE